MEILLRDAQARYSVPESPGEPSREHYAAARRWIACAREARKWATRCPDAAREGWLARAKEALGKAAQHRAAARRWRVGGRSTMNHCSSCQEPILPGEVCPECEPDTEMRAVLLRAAARVERRRAIAAYYSAARQTLKLVRVYREEPGSSGRREREALDEVRRLRAAAAALRLLDRRAADAPMPGVRKAPLSTPPQSERKRPSRANG